MLGRQQLTAVAEARTILLAAIAAIEPGSETITLVDALDRVSCRDILAPEDLPNCDRSTMDGYAVIAADTFGASQELPAYLEVSGEVLMGAPGAGFISRGNCYKIPTGGLLPDKSDGVVMLEHTVPIDDKLIEVVKGIGTGTNVIRKGDDIRTGALAIAQGQLLRPQELGLLAGLGITDVEVYRRPCVGIVATGDEIVEPDAPAPPGKIRNINSTVLSALTRRHGSAAIDYGIVADNEASFFSTVEQAVAENDMVLFSGGSSVGMRDLGEQAIARLAGPGILVHGVALKPGKPALIGLSGNTPVFGLPGHPVSAMVCFDFFVKPALAWLSGHSSSPDELLPTVQARLKRNINSAPGRLDVIRVQLTREDDQVVAQPVLGRSGAISTLSRAHGFFLIAEDSQGCNIDESVEVYIYQ
jgi:molybdopterin molybdotransferase